MGNMLKGKKLFDDENFTLLKTTPFGIRHWLVGNFYVLLKDRGIVKKATLEEKLRLIAIIGELARLNFVAIPSDQHDILFERFSSAVWSEGLRWQMFFINETPEQVAAELICL